MSMRFAQAGLAAKQHTLITSATFVAPAFTRALGQSSWTGKAKHPHYVTVPSIAALREINKCMRWRQDQIARLPNW